jgi:hypothetical protein
MSAVSAREARPARLRGFCFFQGSFLLVLAMMLCNAFSAAKVSAAVVFWLSLSGALRAEAPDISWVESASALVPQGFVAGSVVKTDLAIMTGYLAAFRAGANDPQSPGSAFDWGHVLVVKLDGESGALKAVAGELRERAVESAVELRERPRETSAASTEADYLAIHGKLTDGAAQLPPGTVPCSLGAWSDDKDPAGLNVRAEPRANAKVLGKLPPPFKFKARNKSENTPDGGWRTEFRVIGFKDGWFLIERASPPGKDYEDESVYPKKPPMPYSGRGWVASNKIGAA